MRGAAAAIAAVGLAACSTRENLVPEPKRAHEQALVVECDGRTTEALTRAAVAGAKGLTVVVHNTSDADLGVGAEEDGGGGGGFGAAPGETRGVYPFRPGRLRIGCFDSRKDDPGETPRVTVQVQADSTYALVRDGRNVAIASMHRPENGWLVHLIERCGELDP